MATGVSASRLRTWERRYGIPQPERSGTGRRLYSEEDLAIIRRMAALAEAGIPPSEAAAAAKTEGEVPSVSPPARETPEHPLAISIRDAAVQFDETTTVKAAREAVSSLGWPAALDQVLMPALHGIGQSWGANVLVSANEHFTSEIIRREIAAALAAAGAASTDSRAVLLACPEDERHELGLLAFSLLLRRRGLGTVYLGADVPTSDLLTAVQQAIPSAICLSATTRSGLASLGRAARTLVSARIPLRVFVGGPAFGSGLAGEAIPGVLLPQSLGGAADLVVAALAQG